MNILQRSSIKPLASKDEVNIIFISYDLILKIMFDIVAGRIKGIFGDIVG
jgi:hypothetical protein